MQNNINILITGGGAPGIAGTIYALRNNTGNDTFRVVVTDLDDNVIGKYLADAFYKIPPPEDTIYLQVIKDIAKKENIQVILPQTTREIIMLARHKKDFASSGIMIIVTDYEQLIIANDKYLLLEKAKDAKVPCPQYFLTNSEQSLKKAVLSLGYPEKQVVVKPRISNGMRGTRIVTDDKWNVDDFLQKKPDGTTISLSTLLAILKRGNWPELLVTEYLAGDEYSVDVFRSGKQIVVIPRLRERIRSGITFNARVVLREDIIKYSKALANALDLEYCFGFQFKLNADNIPNLLECNPRVQGTMVTSVFAGCNLIYLAVCKALHRKVSIRELTIKDNLAFQRYWGGVASDDEGFVGKI